MAAVRSARTGATTSRTSPKATAKAPAKGAPVVAGLKALKQPAVRAEGDSRRLGEVLAERIEDEIISSGLPIGTVLGSEPELIERYRVSRAVFREAIRIVDHHGVAQMRRGPGGGLVVAKPDLDAVVRAVALQLEFAHIRQDQVYEARKAIELKCVEIATNQIDEDGERRLRELLEAEEERIKATRQRRRPRGDLPSHDFHSLLAELTGNPAMHLFAQMIILVLGGQSPRAHSLESVAHDVHVAHVKIAEAVIAGDSEVAQRRMAKHLESVMNYIAKTSATGGGGTKPSSPNNSKRTKSPPPLAC